MRLRRCVGGQARTCRIHLRRDRGRVDAARRRTGRWARGTCACAGSMSSRGRPSLPALGGRFPAAQVDAAGGRRRTASPISHALAAALDRHDRPRACRWSPSTPPTTRPASSSRSPDRRASSRRRAAFWCVDAVQAAGRDSDRYFSWLCRLSDPVVAQDRRPQGRRRHRRRGRSDDAEAADHRRRPGKGPSRRHREPRRRSPASARLRGEALAALGGRCGGAIAARRDRGRSC